MLVKGLYILVGPSGSGKSTLMDGLINEGLRKVKTVTTRAPRGDEQDYTFVGKDRFVSLLDLVEYDYYHGNFYGTTSSSLEAGDVCALTPKGAIAVKEVYTQRSVKIIGLTADLGVLKSRLLARGVGVERLEGDLDTFKDLGSLCDFVVETRTPEQTLDDVLKYIRSCEEKLEV